MVENQNLGITWLGHATFVLTSPSGKRILIDPYLTSNPSCPKGQKETDELDLILITHGHHDHLTHEQVFQARRGFMHKGVRIHHRRIKHHIAVCDPHKAGFSWAL